MSNTEIAVPGDELGTTEEFLPGEGTYEDEGRIYSSVVGNIFKDMENLTISVRSDNPPIILQRGDHVITRVIGLYDSMALVQLLMLDGNDRGLAGKDNTATIHVSKIDRRFVEDVKKEFRIGDIVRAEVTKDKPSIDLVTSYPHLGVIRALCVHCRSSLEKKGRDLSCPNCGSRETRKQADDFGNAGFKRRGE